MSVPLLITTTFERRDDAEKMGRMLLEKRLIACAQVSGPVSSSYWWQGRIVSSEEYVLTMKSNEAWYRELEQAICASHPYETPEIVATAISRVSAGYHQWLEAELHNE